jgi:hypothetical protein
MPQVDAIFQLAAKTPATSTHSAAKLDGIWDALIKQ